MTLTFEKALEFTHTVGSSAAYEDEALRGLWLAATSIPPRSTILELGCEYGRSTSLLAQVAKEHGHRLICIDPFVDPASAPVFLQVMRQIQPWLVLFMMTSEDWSKHGLAFGQYVSLLHIDGDHSREALMDDCDLFLRSVVAGGYAVFHDYGGGGTPDVKPVVDSFMAPNEWQQVGVYDTCAVYVRLR